MESCVLQDRLIGRAISKHESHRFNTWAKIWVKLNFCRNNEDHYSKTDANRKSRIAGRYSSCTGCFGHLKKKSYKFFFSNSVAFLWCKKESDKSFELRQKKKSFNCGTIFATTTKKNSLQLCESTSTTNCTFIFQAVTIGTDLWWTGRLPDSSKDLHRLYINLVTCPCVTQSSIKNLNRKLNFMKKLKMM